MSESTDRFGTTWVGIGGRVWPVASFSKRKRFAAKRPLDIPIKFFPTRRAAVLWLKERQAKLAAHHD